MIDFSGGDPWSGIARTVSKAPWKTPDELIAKRSASAVHNPVHGQVIPVFMGTYSTEGKVFWKDGPRLVTTEKVTTDRFGITDWFPEDNSPWTYIWPWTRTTTTTTTRAFASFAVAHSFNQFQRPGRPLKVEFDDVVVFDETSGQTLPSGLVMRIYDGIDNEVDPTMLATDGAAKTPAYHGLRYLFFENIDLDSYGGTIPASIRVLWTDTASAVASGATTLPLLGSLTAGYLQGGNTKLCFDEALNRFYLGYDKDGEALTNIYVGTTDFNAGAETSLALLTDKPDAAVDTLYGACALPGTGLFLAICTKGTYPTGNNWDVLVEAETGGVLASFTNGGSDETEWLCALPFLGGSETTYIAAGRITLSNTAFNMEAHFAAVNVSSPSISLLKYGLSQGTNGTVFITPGKADSEATTFFLLEPSAPAKIWKASFADLAPPTVTLIYTAPTGWSGSGLKYDAGLDLIAVSEHNGTANRARGISAADGTVDWVKDLPSGSAGQYEVVPTGSWLTNSFYQGVGLTARLRAGYCVLDNTGGVAQHILMNMADGSYVEIGQVAGVNGDHFDQLTGSLYRLDDNEWDAVVSQRFTGGTVTVAEELTTFSKFDTFRGLLTDAQVTTVGLGGLANGGVHIDSDTDLRQLASRIAELYGIDKVETATGVKWVKKATDGGYAADVVLTEADLVEAKSGDATVEIATRDKNPLELPAEVEVRYISSDAEYNVMPARASWPNGVFEVTKSLVKKSLPVPVVLDDQQALELAWGVLARTNAARKLHSFTLRPKRLKVEPSDVFDLTADGRTITGKVTRETKRPDHALEITADGYLSRAATTVVAATPLSQSEPAPNPTTRHVFLDGPLLRSGHDKNGTGLVQYHVLTGRTGWPGGELYRKRPGESGWTKITELAGVVPVVGVLTTALAAPAVTFETDSVNTFTIRLVAGAASEIASQTETQYYDASSYALVGAPGRWLALTWRNRTVNADGTITFDTLFQGLKGTEPYQGTSKVGDIFVLVKPNYWLKVDYDLTDIDDAIQFRAVGYGQNPALVPGRSFTVSGAAETPIAPHSHKAVINGSDIDLTWQRSSRLYSPWLDDGDGTSGGLGSDLDVYKVEILSGPGGSVLRTYLDVAGQSKVYPEADVIADFGVPSSVLSSLTYRVSQKSSIAAIGYGHTAVWTVGFVNPADLLGAGGGDVLGAGNGDYLGAG